MVAGLTAVRWTLFFGLTILGAGAVVLGNDSTDIVRLAQFVRQLNPNVLRDGAGDASEPDRLRRVVADDIRRRRQELNRRDLEAWQPVRGRDDWEKMKAPRIEALRRSLGQFPEPPRDLHVQVIKALQGEGFRIDCLVFESRPGLLVTANLYRPAKPPGSMPGILICHSHHNPNTQGELQDMGMTWARQGCLVLVMDQLGHGERRQHPFRTAADFPKPFPVGRQDYYFRYNVGMQLHLIGDSLIGWMAWDLMRGVDLLLSQPGVDPERIILLGAVAGGGDPAAVAAAIDPRVKAVVPFNFGGPQPETVYPLPDDAERSFNYIGEGSWESTRDLRLSARDGFLPWVIVGSIAPRRLVYAHEFSWDRPKDPVWKRIEAIYGFYGAAENLSSAHGWGGVQLSSAQASHCNNIGLAHRKQMHPAMQKWFGIASDEEHRDRRPDSELLCVEGVPAAQRLKLPRVCDLADRIAGERLAALRQQTAGLTPQARREALRRKWSGLLGDVQPLGGLPQSYGTVPLRPVRDARGLSQFSRSENGTVPFGRVIRVAFKTQQGILVPVLVLLPSASGRRPRPCVLAVAQGGKEGFLKGRPDEIARLLARGIAVCLPDVRGTGETSLGKDRGRTSQSTALSSSEMMLGGTLVGLRLADLRSVLHWLKTLPEIDPRRIAVWGDSFAPANGPSRRIEVPLGISEEPDLAEPLGPLLALLAGLYEDDVAAVVARSGLVGFRSVLSSPLVHVPHDVIVPGAVTAGDIADVAAALAPRPVLAERFVDGTNRAVPPEAARQEWAIAASAFQSAGVPQNLVIADGGQPFLDWLVRRLGGLR